MFNSLNFHPKRKPESDKPTFSKNRDSVPTPCLLGSATDGSLKFSNLGFFCSQERHWYNSYKLWTNITYRTWKWKCDRMWTVSVCKPWPGVCSPGSSGAGFDSRSDWASVYCWAASFWWWAHGRSSLTLPSQLWSYLTSRKIKIGKSTKMCSTGYIIILSNCYHY